MGIRADKNKQFIGLIRATIRGMTYKLAKEQASLETMMYILKHIKGLKEGGVLEEQSSK